MSNPRPIMQTAAGIAFDLVEPTPAMINFDDIAEHLGKIARFAGATPGHFYSVAEHCVRAAAAAADDGANNDVVAAALLHDAHEAYIVDRITPERWAEEKIGATKFGYAGAEAIHCVPRMLRERIDEAIFRAAGLSWPLLPTITGYIKRIDSRMLATERRDLMRKGSVPWPHLDGVEPYPERIAPWSWTEAWRQYRDCARGILPVYRAAGDLAGPQ